MGQPDRHSQELSLIGHDIRERILEDLKQQYKPCGGSFCCCSTPAIDDSPMREGCLCCEVCCCPYLATLVNRDLVMYNYRVDFDQCDEFIISCVLCLTVLLAVWPPLMN